MDKKDHIPVAFCTSWYQRMYKRHRISICLVFALVWVLISSCINEYTPKGVNELGGLLVVDGYITNGESVFTLRKSLEMSSPMYEEETVDNAALNVECSDGTIMLGVFSGKGKYVVQTGDLHPEKEYRLNFSVDGKIYQSEHLLPVMTTEIDSISYTKEGEGKPVYIRVSAHDAENKSPYYRWTYTETWEVKAPFFANASQTWPEDPLIIYDLNSSNNIYYCWGRKESRVLLLESTEKLSENVVFQNKLIEIPCDHDKLSILYHVTVRQMQIRYDAYTYFAVLRNTAERTGGLFSPVLSAGMEGNIRCLTNSEIPVIGYVEVATTTATSMFVNDKNLYEPPPFDCKALPLNYFGHPLYQYEISRAEKRCVDCRTKENASKEKPEWWPTSHL